MEGTHDDGAGTPQAAGYDPRADDVQTVHLYRDGELAGTAVALGERLKFFAADGRYRPLDGRIFADTAAIYAAMDAGDRGETAARS